MQMTFRWFGKEKDTVSLEQVRRGPWTEYRPCMTRSLLPG